MRVKPRIRSNNWTKVYHSPEILNAVENATGVKRDHRLWDPLFDQNIAHAEKTFEDLFILPGIFMDPGDYNRPSQNITWGAEIGPEEQSDSELLNGRRLAISRGVTALSNLVSEYRAELLDSDSTTTEAASIGITKLGMYTVKFALEYEPPELITAKPAVVKVLNDFAYLEQRKELERLIGGG